MAGRAAIKRARQPRVLGVAIPRQIELPKLDLKKLAKDVDLKKVAKDLDLKKVAKQVAEVSEQIEARSEDVRFLSGQAKRLSKKLS